MGCKTMKEWMIGAASAVLAMSAAASASAGVIVSPTTIAADTTFPGYDVTALIDQSGLTAGFVSEVTDFDAYMAGDPHHSWQLANEWFSAANLPGAVLTMDLGQVFRIQTAALWVDEYWGAGAVTVATSLDGVTFTDVGASALSDWATGPQNYPADLVALSDNTGRYVRLTLSGCPSPLSAPDGGCGLGEVAFEVTTVPEPAAWALMIAGFGAVGATLRRRRASAVFA